MNDHEHLTAPALAIFTMAAVKAAIDAFEGGESNVRESLDAIIAAIDEFHAGAADRTRREAA